MFKEEIVVAGVDLKRVHVIYRKMKVVNVGTANMTDKEADVTVKKKIKQLKAELTKEILNELTPKEVMPPVTPKKEVKKV